MGKSLFAKNATQPSGIDVVWALKAGLPRKAGLAIAPTGADFERTGYPSDKGAYAKSTYLTQYPENSRTNSRLQCLIPPNPTPQIPTASPLTRFDHESV